MKSYVTIEFMILSEIRIEDKIIIKYKRIFIRAFYTN